MKSAQGAGGCIVLLLILLVGGPLMSRWTHVDLLTGMLYAFVAAGFIALGLGLLFGAGIYMGK